MMSTWAAVRAQRTADESVLVSKKACRDGASMKTIAGLNMVYLPATFVATVFGMGFFSFGTDGKAALVVNSDIWKFVAVSLTFSVITVFLWLYVSVNETPRVLRSIKQWLKRPERQRTGTMAVEDQETAA